MTSTPDRSAAAQAAAALRDAGVDADAAARLMVWFTLRNPGQDPSPDALAELAARTAPTWSDLHEMLSGAAYDAAELTGKPVWCGGCEQWETPRSCPACRGSGSAQRSIGVDSSSAAWAECGHCAGNGTDHAPAGPPT